MANSAFCVMKDAVSRERLRDLRIRVTSEITLGEDADDTIECWVITQAGLRKLSDYGYNTNSTIPAGVDGFQFVALCNPDGSPASTDVDPASIKIVNIERWSGSSSLREYLTDLAKELLVPAFNKHVKISVPHNNLQSAQPVDSDTLHVFVWSSPQRGVMHHPDTMWDFNVPCRDASNFGVWMEGEPIICSEGEEVGAVDASNLFIYHDAVETDTEASRAILRKFFEAAADIHVNGTRYDMEMIKERYITACSARVDNERKDLTNIMKVSKDRCSDLQKDLTKCIRDYKDAEFKLSHFEEYTKTLSEQLGREFDNVLNIPKVKAVSWRGNSLSVETDVLYVIHPETGNEHEIGAFKLIIDQRTSSVIFSNITRKVHGYNENMNGPHIFPDGRPCLGSLQETIPQLVSAFEWSALIQVCIAFIESVNLADSAGRHLGRWPISRTKSQIEEGVERDRREAIQAATEGAELGDEMDFDDDEEIDEEGVPEEEPDTPAEAR